MAKAKLWRAQRDSNPQSPPSEGGALSNYAMGTANLIISISTKNASG